MIGLLVDDAAELQRLGRVQRRCCAEHGGRRALDRGQRRPQLVAHHVQKLGAHAFHFVERRQVLHRDHHRCDGAVFGADGGRVDQDPDVASLGNREHDLLAAHRLAAAQLLCERKLGEDDLVPVRTPARDLRQQIPQRPPRRVQALHDPPGFVIEGQHIAGAAVEDHDADRRGFDQGLQIGPSAVLVAVGTGVGDRRGRLRGEQYQDLFVLAGERFAACLGAEKEAAHVHVAIVHRRALERDRGDRPRGVAERAYVGGYIRLPQRPRQVAEVLEQPPPVRPVHQSPKVGIGESGGREVLDPAGFVDGGDRAEPGAGQGAGALHHLVEHVLEVETGVDAQDGSAQPCDALAQRFVLPLEPAAAHVALRRRRLDRGAGRRSGIAPWRRWSHQATIVRGAPSRQPRRPALPALQRSTGAAPETPPHSFRCPSEPIVHRLITIFSWKITIISLRCATIQFAGVLSE